MAGGLQCLVVLLGVVSCVYLNLSFLSSLVLVVPVIRCWCYLFELKYVLIIIAGK